MNLNDVKSNILDNIIKLAKRQDLTARDWADSVQAFTDAKNGHAFMDSEKNEEIRKKEFEAERELIIANQRIKNRTLLGSDLKLLQMYENILGEDRPTAPALTVESERVFVGKSIFINFTKSISTIYKDEEMRYELLVKTLEGNFKVITPAQDLMRPSSRIGVSTEWVANATGDTIVNIAVRAVSPSGMVSGSSNSYNIKIVNSRFIGFFQNCHNHTSKRIGSNSIEDSLWLPISACKINEFSKYVQPNPIDDLLDSADYLPYKYMKRYIIKHDGVRDSWVDTSELNNFGAGLGKVPTSKYYTDQSNSKISQLLKLDPKTYNIMVRIPEHYEIDTKFEWNGNRYYFKAVSMEPFEVDVQEEGFPGATGLHGRANITGTRASAVKINEFWIGAFRSSLLEGKYCVSNLNGATASSLNADNTNTARVNTSIGKFRNYTQALGVDYKIHNYIQVRTIHLLAQCEKGSLGDLSTYWSTRSDMTIEWNKYYAKETDTTKKPYTKSKWLHSQDWDNTWNSKSYVTLKDGDDHVSYWHPSNLTSNAGTSLGWTNYRGIENWVGDLWVGVDGMTIHLGQPYIAEADTTYIDGKTDGNYKPICDKISDYQKTKAYITELQAGELYPTQTGFSGSQLESLGSRYWGDTASGHPFMFFCGGDPNSAESDGWNGSLGLCSLFMYEQFSLEHYRCGSRLSLSRKLDMPTP